MPASRSICVFCGSRPGARPAYRDAARAVGALIAARGWRLVYGAGDAGLMGAVAEAARGSAVPPLGVIPAHLLSRERVGAGRDAEAGGAGAGGAGVVVTETMHERKKVMFMNSDAVVVLAGGAGSLDEFFEVLTWRQIGLHEKPLFLLDTEGIWAPLTALIDHVIAEGFAEPGLRAYFETAADVASLGTRLDEALA